MKNLLVFSYVTSNLVSDFIITEDGSDSSVYKYQMFSSLRDFQGKENKFYLCNKRNALLLMCFDSDFDLI